MITRIDPPEFDKVSVVQVDSDANNLWLAIDEVEQWAVNHGFFRTTEFQLRPVLIAGKRGFRGICYRPTPEESAAADQDNRDRAERAARMPVTPHLAR